MSHYWPSFSRAWFCLILACAWMAGGPAGVAGAQEVAEDQLRPVRGPLLLRATSAASWTRRETNIILLQGGVEIQAGEANLRAQEAVLWIQKLPGAARSRVDIVLLGGEQQEAEIATDEFRRAGPVLAVDLVTEGGVRMEVPERAAADLSDTEIYRRALEFRPVPRPPPVADPEQPAPERPESTPLTPQVTFARAPVRLSARVLRTTPDDEGNLAILATGGVVLLQRTEEDDLLELTADRAVVFTTLQRLDEVGGLDSAALQEAIATVYLEGDVRIIFTPSPRRRREGGFGAQEQRLEARRAFYDFATERALMSEVVLHTSEPFYGQPLTLRAQLVRQLAQGQYDAYRAEVSTSRFAVPDYSLNASRIFIRSTEERAVFGGDHFTARLFGIPFFYFPVVRGATVDGRLPLRRVELGSSRGFGSGIETEWGLFETFGATPPQTLDATYTFGYYEGRGPLAGLDAEYYGDIFRFGNQPEVFEGALTGLAVYDEGADRLGGRRAQITQDGPRGRFFWQHQHFFPAGFSAQGRAGWASDPTFIEQWEREQFWNGPPHDLFFNVERADANEVYGVTFSFETNDFATFANRLQENAAAERLPEAWHARLGQRLGPFTLNSRNRLGMLQFNNYGADPFFDLGFRDAVTTPEVDESFRGIPSFGYTGTPERLIGRGDFRQELNLPVQSGPLSITPFAVGRFTAYSDHVDGSALARLLGGVGARVGTAITGTSDRAYSRILDIDRLRHVIEPSVTGFASWQNRQDDTLYIFDQQIDDISAIRAVQFAVRQRWQTMRGAPGRQRSVDVLSWSIEANFFDNQRPEVVVPTNVGPATAADFRGLFFAGEPEASLARDGINSDALWRISDTTAVVGQGSWSLETDELATLAGGLIVSRGDRVTWSVGGRHVEPLALTLAVGSITYDLSQRYLLAAAASFDIDDGSFRTTTLFVTRRYDRLHVNVGVFYDAVDDNAGIRFNVIPVGFRQFMLTSQQLQHLERR